MIADLLAPPVRKRVYEVLFTLSLLEAIWDIIPNGDVEGRIFATLGVLGFGIARANTGKPAA